MKSTVSGVFEDLKFKISEGYNFWKMAGQGEVFHSNRGFTGVLYTTVLLPSHARFKGVLILSDSLLFFAQALYASYLCFVTAIPVYFDSHRQYTGIFLRTFL